MATYTTLARPYATAAFEYACAHHSVEAWEDMLIFATSLIRNEQIAVVLNHPMIAQEKKLELLFSFFKNSLEKPYKNFLALLANKKRLSILPEITQLFMALRKQKEKRMTVMIKSPFPLDSEQIERFKKALKIRLQADIDLEVSEDKNLIGGAKIYAGSFVIDGTVKAQLERLKQTLFA
jgi:F-type H+-transporting ATPase subunit delta